jgi:hypothetical protein
MTSISTKEHLLMTLKENFSSGVIFTLKQVYDLVLNQNRIPELYEGTNEEAVVRAAIQRLGQDKLLNMMCRDSMDLNGLYSLPEPKNTIDPNENIFDLEQLEKFGRITKAPGITFDGWAILPKDEVMSHSVARELGIECQTRVGQALFQTTIDEITNSVYSEGYDYRCFQPAVSKLETPIEHDGKTYIYIVRDGNNRYELPWKHFPCAIISGESEYSLLQYGAISNNPTKEKKNDCTPDDVKYMIQLGFKYNEIQKDYDSIHQVLVDLYKETRKKDRRNFVAEILGEEGIKLSIEPYNIDKAEKTLKKVFNINNVCGERINQMNESQTSFAIGWGRKPDHYRKFYLIFEKQLQYPDNQYTAYSYLEQGQGVSVEPNEKNIDELRTLMEGERKRMLKHYRRVLKAYDEGTLKPLDYKWLPQANNVELYNEFQ